MPEAIIEVESVTKRFGTFAALSNLTFAVKRGEVLGLLGPNGSGKTTTVRVLNGVLRHDSGRITIAGRNPADDHEAIRKLSGVLTESAGLYGHLTGLQNLRFFGDLYGVTEPRRAETLLEMLGLGSHQNKKAATYSTGMRKRLGLAKALLHSPKILFLDEPTSGLDPEATRLVVEYIHNLNLEQHVTVILCSHLLHQLETVCDRYVFLEKGHVLESGSLAELRQRYLRRVLLDVGTDAQPEEDTYLGAQVVERRPGQVRFSLPNQEAVPSFIRQLSAAARLFWAVPAEDDLESLYFRIRREADL